MLVPQKVFTENKVCYKMTKLVSDTMTTSYCIFNDSKKMKKQKQQPQNKTNQKTSKLNLERSLLGQYCHL